MDQFWISYFFLIGLVFGSFFNVVGLRLPNGQSFVKPRSHCPACKKTLGSLELIPFFSYFLLKGKCKGCGKRISIVYPLFELITGILFAYSFLLFGWSIELLVSLLFVSMLVIIFVSDSTYMLIPDKLLLTFAPLLLVLRLFFEPLNPWWDALLGAVVGFGLLFFIALVSRGGMGGGDIKLFGVLGIVLGLKGVLLAFFLSTLFGAVFGMIGLWMGKVKRGQPMAFGPYIVIATIITYFHGQDLIDWYLQFF